METCVQLNLVKERSLGKLKRILGREEGATVSEYALVLALVTIAVIGALTSLGTTLSDKITGIVDSLIAGG